MLPEIYEAPYAMPLAIAVLVSMLVYSSVLLVRPSQSSARTRPLFHIAGTLVSFLTLVELGTVYQSIWAGSGTWWLWLLDSHFDESLVRNLVLWIPLLMLSFSVFLASVSRERRLGLVVWGLFTVPLLVWMVYAVAVLGVAGGTG